MSIICLHIIRGLTRLVGNLVKILSYPFHWLFPSKRFEIPFYSPAFIKSKHSNDIPKILWQTNYTNKVTLPIYINYLFNRLMTLDYEYYYHGDEERLNFIKENGNAEQFNAFCRLTDGASQADFWRLFVLYIKGGVYLDIDGQLIYPLNQIINTKDKELIVYRQCQTKKDYTQYFIASEPNNPLMLSLINQIIENIKNEYTQNGVYHLTGPGVLNKIIGDKEINCRLAKLVCHQGSFTNEYFQYMDKKRSKWIYKKNNELLKTAKEE